MRLLFFNRSFHPDTASTGQLLTELCEDLAREQDRQVTAIAAPVRDHPTPRAGFGFFSTRETYRNITILRTRSTSFSKASFPGRASNYLTYFGSALFAGWFGERPDIVIAYSDPPIIGLAAWLRARVLGARFVMVCQDIFPEVAVLLEGFKKGLLYSVLDRISRFLLNSADAVVAIGETMRQRILTNKNVAAVKLHVIHNWADSSAILPAARDNAFSRTNNLTGRFVVMHSGNIGLSQSLETLIDAASLLQEVKDLVVVIVGDGAKKEALQRLAEQKALSNVLFLPYQDKEKLTESFAAADVFVISLKQGMAGYIVPSKLYGILAAGRPYVAAVEEESEVIAITRQYHCGLTAQPGDPRDLTDKILQLYGDAKLRESCGTNARAAVSEFNRPRQVEKYIKLFRELIAEKNPERRESRVQ